MAKHKCCIATFASVGDIIKDIIRNRTVARTSGSGTLRLVMKMETWGRPGNMRPCSTSKKQASAPGLCNFQPCSFGDALEHHFHNIQEAAQMSWLRNSHSQLTQPAIQSCAGVVAIRSAPVPSVRAARRAASPSRTGPRPAAGSATPLAALQRKPHCQKETFSRNLSAVLFQYKPCHRHRV